MTDLYDAKGTQLAERARLLAAEHGPFASPHEAYGVLAEELAELLDEVRRRSHNGVRLRDEALDIAAAALRYAVQLEAAWEAREPVALVEGEVWKLIGDGGVTITFDPAGDLQSMVEAEPMAKPSEEPATDDGTVCDLCDGTGEVNDYRAERFMDEVLVTAYPRRGISVRCWRCSGTGVKATPVEKSSEDSSTDVVR